MIYTISYVICRDCNLCVLCGGMRLKSVEQRVFENSNYCFSVFLI
ncbi:unnamed protein product [Arabidopsis thaliana]|uniref:Uncharacterized protein n=4 Tax=Arabidopsis TaxID=3701 RepID=A0A654G0G3_ARATH|nr:uncharacterized protein AT5G12236 [Arabidopsis thaliana]KAG7602013.1 hypothetical protein ISN45_At05g011310 [Arabidopsis thaliana x Arabidopsis arenosa]KAG7608966.1 hypothetical protein ISN44_As05g011320 [Arabidopsis suecica]AED91780.1 hypothetical protein AT5G12236 [Arabidopsis thaliana]CAA0402174.1 unnamed protein product [Arabidopsis thaliana]VYS66622.1 unnamed protein product [Arabidopsis thaliana]|eukprot:NP_001119214.1 hypothetical protein AT5G12236 [Arabidopsis thaliana]